MQHFTREQVLALPHDAYTSVPNKLRIVCQGDDEHPWMLDAYDAQRGSYTEACWTYRTFEEAVAAIPAFIEECAPHLSARSLHIMRTAYYLLGDGDGGEYDDNAEYTRAIVELVGDLVGLSITDDKPLILDCIRRAGHR